MRWEGFENAERQLVEHYSAGRDGIPIIQVLLTRQSDGRAVIAALERVVRIASSPLARAHLRTDLLKVRARDRLWDGFERDVHQSLRDVARLPGRPAGLVPSLISRADEVWRNRELLLRDIALAAARFLWCNDRHRMAGRVLARVDRLGDKHARALATSERGMQCLAAGDIAAAMAHYRRLDTPFQTPLQDALAARGLLARARVSAPN